MLRHLIESRGVSQTHVARATGIGNSTLSEILKGKRKIARKYLGGLAKYFKVDPG
jgi:transcriptional regulator with XRE-family HTH domain